MIVTPIKDRKDPTRTIAMIDGYTAVFPKHTPTPEAYIDVEVMITGIHFHMDSTGRHFDYTSPSMLFIRPITDYYTLVEHDGFQMQGTLCITNARCKFEGRTITLTPGRVGVRWVDNVSIHKEYTTPVPGKAYVRRQDIVKSITRIEGVAAFEDLQYFATRK